MVVISPYKQLRLPPQDLDAEQAVLGALMIRGEVVYDVSDVLVAGAFYADKHRMIYEGMLDLFNRREPIDLLMVTSRLREKGVLEQIGGASYLVELTELVPSAANSRFYAERISEKYVLRLLIEASEKIANLGFVEGEQVELLLDRAEKAIHDVTNTRLGGRSFVALKDLLLDARERLVKIHEHTGDALRGISTGFIELDHKLGGFQKSDLIILAARPSMGKTALALDIARHAATKGKVPTLVFSLEMSKEQLVDRMVVAEAKVDSWKYRRGKLSIEHDFGHIYHALDALNAAPLYIDDQPAATITQMRSVARRIKSEHGLGLIVVDYLQLMATNQRYDSMVNQVTEISRSLKQLARDMEVPVLALSQLSRAVESRRDRPRLSDLRDSGSIEQDADVVMFIHNESIYKDGAERTNNVEILIEKHRNGPTGKVDLLFDTEKTTFVSIDTALGFNDFKKFDKNETF